MQAPTELRPYVAREEAPVERERLTVGQRVVKITGYRALGTVRGIATTEAGETRYVVEHIVEGGGRILHIYSPANLRAATSEDETAPSSPRSPPMHDSKPVYVDREAAARAVEARAEQLEADANDAADVGAPDTAQKWRQQASVLREAAAALRSLPPAASTEVERPDDSLHHAYLRLRGIIPGAWKTPHGPTPEQVWQVTEDAAKALVAERDALRRGLAEARAREESVKAALDDEERYLAKTLAKRSMQRSDIKWAFDAVRAALSPTPQDAAP